MPELTRRQIALVLGGALAALTLAIGIYGLITGPTTKPRDTPAGNPAIRVEQPTPAANGAIDPSQVPIPPTTDPVAFARSIASAIFEWDTTSGYLPTDYQAPVLAEADPSGEETPALIDDIATYMPTVDQWLDLATMNVIQTLVIDSAQVPASWTSAVAQAHGELRPGTSAVTITGTRSREGIWNGEASSKSSPVSFTVFVACPPAFDRCHLLRLSQLNNPLR